MINQLLKWSLLVAIWRKYGEVIKLVPFLLILIVIVYAIHKDFIAYVEVSNEKRYLALSFILKWAAIFLVGFLYWRYVRRTLNPHRKQNRDFAVSWNTKKSDGQSELQGGPSEKKNGTGDADNTECDSEDPFAHVRYKKRLDSRADKILKKSPNRG